MTVAELVQAIQDENGSRMIGQMGRDGLEDLIWGVHPTYHKMSQDERAAVRDAVGTELFG